MVRESSDEACGDRKLRLSETWASLSGLGEVLPRVGQKVLVRPRLSDGSYGEHFTAKVLEVLGPTGRTSVLIRHIVNKKGRKIPPAHVYEICEIIKKSSTEC